MVAHDHQRARPERRVEAAGGVGQHDDPRAEPPEQQDRLDDEPRVVALVQVEAALEHDDRAAREPAEEQPSGVPGRGRGGPAGQVGERDRDGILEVVREAAEPRAEHDPDLGHEVGPGTHRGHERGEPRGLVDGRDRARRVDRASSRDIGASTTHRGSTVEAGGFAGPTEVSTPGCRSRPAGHGPPGVVVRRRPAGNEAPEATGGGAKGP